MRLVFVAMHTAYLKTFAKTLPLVSVWETFGSCSPCWLKYQQLVAIAVGDGLSALMWLIRRQKCRPECNKYADLRGRPYIHTCRSYEDATRYSTNVASLLDESASVRATRICPILAFWGSKVSQNGAFPCLWRWWTAVHNLTSLALYPWRRNL